MNYKFDKLEQIINNICERYNSVVFLPSVEIYEDYNKFRLDYDYIDTPKFFPVNPTSSMQMEFFYLGCNYKWRWVSDYEYNNDALIVDIKKHNNKAIFHIRSSLWYIKPVYLIERTAFI